MNEGGTTLDSLGDTQPVRPGCECGLLTVVDSLVNNRVQDEPKLTCTAWR